MKSPQISSLRASRSSSERGFTLLELMVGLVLLAAVAWGLTTILIHSAHNRTSTMNQLESTQAASAALNLIAGDVRSAGYGTDADEMTPQPAVAYVDPQELVLSENLQPYPDDPISHQAPQAYDPAGNPRPKPLDGTVWQPPMKYHYGAELVRYTLDLNNDGVVDAGDLATTDGSDARRTTNPNDYVLVRQVYGDSVGNVAHNNGGSTERIAIISKPGGTIPPIYTVFMRGQSVPWDWVSGPVPPSRLGDIERVELRVNSPSSKPDSRGQYANTELKTTVSSMRNSPLIGPPTYVVDGYVFNDLNHNDTKDAGELGIPSTNVRLGNVYTCYTASNGYYFMRAPAGTYTLRHTPAAGYGVWSNPDSFVATVVNTAIHHDFADTARAGGWVTALAFNDLNGNGVQEAGEGPLSNIKLVITPPGTGAVFTDASGSAQMFAPVGGFSVAATPPDSLVATTANPVSGTMTNGGSASIQFGFRNSATGTIRGKVFRDNNRNAVFDGSDTGIPNVYVGVTSDNGLTMVGFAYTDANGDYSITVPINDPPHTKPYMVFDVAPAGFFPTSATAIPNLWVQAGVTLTGKNFGVGSYQIITLNASRVLSLAAADLIEKDWNGNHTENAVMDKDLVLGADAGGTDNVSVWFNNYNNTPLFSGTPTYTRNAPNSVMSMAVDTLDTDDPVERPDVVTGTKLAIGGNFFVWLNQNSSGNLGYLPTTYSPGLAYRTSDGGDVQAVLTKDVAGGSMPDIIVGTKSPTSGRGTFEVWQSDDAASPTFSQQEVYPTAGSIPGNRMGEVTAMTWGDIDGDGNKDLIIGTKTGLFMGELLVFQLRSKNNGNRFVCKQDISILDGQVTSLAVADVDQDGRPDIVVGVQESNATGSLRYYHNINNLVSFGFTMVREVPTPGIPTALAAADLGGGAGSDIAMGWRSTDTGYAGGILIYYTDILNIPFSGVDPSSGTIRNFVPAVATANFNYGLQPTTPSPPYLTDLACGIKSSPSTGALVVFIR